jgi:hypothetical protein
MKAYSPVIIVVIAIIVIVVLVLRVPEVRHWIEQHKAVLDCLSIVGVIGLVLSLLLTVSQFRSVQQQQKREQEAAFHSRMKTLRSELEVNTQICNKEFLDPNAEYMKDPSLPVPKSQFQLNIIKNTLASGDITDETARQVLWDVYRKMSVVNRLLDQALEVNIQGFVPNVSGAVGIPHLIARRKRLVEDAMQLSEEIRDLLIRVSIANGVLRIVDE